MNYEGKVATILIALILSLISVFFGSIPAGLASIAFMLLATHRPF